MKKKSFLLTSQYIGRVMAFKSAERTITKMEKHIIICNKEVYGRSQKTTRMIENVVKHNALNKTGHINYNKGAIKDGVGFQSCSDKFVDNFILRVLVADYLIYKKSYTKDGSINRTIRAMLDRNGLKNAKLKQSL